MIRIVTILFIVTGFFYACEDIRSYPPEPEIEYITHRIIDSSTVLGTKRFIYFEFKFADGDGDFSYYRNPNDTADTTTNSSVFLSFYKKTNGIYNNTAVINTSTKLPYSSIMDKTGQNKTITGKISIASVFIIEPHDTIKLEFFIKDRAYHKSNTVEIPEEIIIKD